MLLFLFVYFTGRTGWFFAVRNCYFNVNAKTIKAIIINQLFLFLSGYISYIMHIMHIMITVIADAINNAI